MRVVIVGRTKMYGDARCIGGIEEATGRSVRLLNGATNFHARDAIHWDVAAPLCVGQIWDLTYTPIGPLTPPHVEDVLVTAGAHVGVAPNLTAFVLSLQPWRGGIQVLFGGRLGFTGNHNGYISPTSIPDRSTWFWVPDRPLTLRANGTHYDYPTDIGLRGMKYVGEPEAIPTIPAGALIRVSLARWWSPTDADVEERCYLQLSGWFL